MVSPVRRTLSAVRGARIMSHQSRCLYLDYNATTPLRPAVKDLMVEMLEFHGNPSSSHAYGRKPKEVLETSRAQVARAIGADPGEIYFCSCGTEADQWVLWSSIVSRWSSHRKPHVVASAIEHPAVLKNLEFLANTMGMCSFTLVPVDGEGFVDMAALEAAISEDTCLVTIMCVALKMRHSNNEVGTIQDLNRIADIVRRHNETRTKDDSLALHSDLAQSVGRYPIDVRDLGLDFGTIVGHKIGAPKGIAALYVAKGRRDSLVPLIHGGGQEFGMRSGTENVMLCAALGLASELATENLDEAIGDMRKKRDVFLSTLQHVLGSEVGSEVGSVEERARVLLNGPSDPASGLPNMVSFSVPGVEAAAVIARVGDRVAVSSGSACHTGKSGGGVLHAMGKTDAASRGTFRASWGFGTSDEDVRQGAQVLGHAIAEGLR